MKTSMVITGTAPSDSADNTIPKERSINLKSTFSELQVLLSGTLYSAFLKYGIELQRFFQIMESAKVLFNLLTGGPGFQGT